MPVWSPLAALTRELPPAVYLLIDAIDNQHRGVELPCHRDFWLAVQEELLPLVRGHARSATARSDGGGRAKLWRPGGDVRRLNWPQRFGCVLSQSGSYWWPHRDGAQDGLYRRTLRQGEVSAGLRIWLEAGQREPIIFRANQALLAQLTHSRRFSGVRLTAGMMRFAGAAG
jgi:enterochelin esterase family protein